MALEIDGIVPETLTVNGTQVERLFVDGTEVWQKPVSAQIEFDTDLSGNVIFTVYGDGVEVDNGDGAYIYYPAGAVDIIPTGTVKLRFGVGMDRISFYDGGTTDTRNRYTSVTIHDATQLTSMASMFRSLINMINFNVTDLSSTNNVIDFQLAWVSCSSLTSFPGIDTSSGISFNQTWNGCSGLTSFPAIDTSKGTNFANLWNNCSNLICISEVNTLGGIAPGIFDNCTSLIAPNASEQTDILNGYNYVNGSPCP